MQFIELLGCVVGLAYLWLEYRASIYLWVASVVMPAIYLVVYYDAGLYADMAINIYYLLIAIYGWAAWRYSFSFTRQKKSDARQLSISHLPQSMWLPMGVLSAVLTVAIAQVLIHLTPSTVPWADAFTTALSVVGMWMLARKYIEQWWVWLIVDMASTALYIYKDLHFTAALYLLYGVVAVMGYRKWKELMNSQDER